jgi:hypothetical protein
MTVDDAPVLQLKSRKLCFSILFGTRKKKVSSTTNPVPHIQKVILFDSRKKFFCIPTNPRDENPFPENL